MPYGYEDIGSADCFSPSFWLVDDHSRVILHGKNPDQDTDYINANYIDVSTLSVLTLETYTRDVH